MVTLIDDSQFSLIKAFDIEFSTLANVAMAQAETKDDASLLDTICTNIRNET